MNLMNRKPTSPGEILDEEFLKPLGLSQTELAKHIRCDVKVINRIINGRSGISAAIALKLSAALRTTTDFWMNAQKAVDMYHAKKKLKNLPRAIKKAA